MLSRDPAVVKDPRVKLVFRHQGGEGQAGCGKGHTMAGVRDVGGVREAEGDAPGHAREDESMRGPWGIHASTCTRPWRVRILNAV